MATSIALWGLGAVASLNVLAIENVPPHFLTHVYYGQTAGWIRIQLGTEVGLGPGGIVLDGDPAPLRAKWHSSPPTFQPTPLACIPAGPHFTHNPCCRLGSAWQVALMAILWIIATRLDYFCF